MLTKVVTPEAETKGRNRGASARKSASKENKMRKPNATIRLSQKSVKRSLALSVLKTVDKDLGQQNTKRPRRTALSPRGVNTVPS